MADILKQMSVGMKVHAKYSDGEFYPAEVLLVSDSKKRSKAPVKVHFSGYEAEDDTWKSLADLKSKKLGLTGTKATAKAKVKAEGKAVDKPPAGVRLAMSDEAQTSQTVVAEETNWASGIEEVLGGSSDTELAAVRKDTVKSTANKSKKSIVPSGWFQGRGSGMLKLFFDDEVYAGVRCDFEGFGPFMTPFEFTDYGTFEVVEDASGKHKLRFSGLRADSATWDSAAGSINVEWRVGSYYGESSKEWYTLTGQPLTQESNK